jgi:hypothetical protein
MDDPGGRRRRRAAALLLVLAGALALAAAGCGGKSADEQASEAYANSVCDAVAGWETQVESIATDLSGGISEASLRSKVTQVESATRSVVKEIKAVPAPDSSQGQATREQLDQLSTDLTTTVAAIRAAAAGLESDASAMTIAAAAVTLAPQVTSLATSAQSTISTLKSSKDALSSAFESADSCKSLGSDS